MATCARTSRINRNDVFFEQRISDMKVVPLNDKIVVKRLEAEDRTAGGIVLPDSAKEKPRQGKVLSLGDGKLLENGKRAGFQVKEGDKVLFSSYAGNEVTVDNEEYLIMSEDDILAVIE
jgi:chaperonin GroES